MTKEKQLLRLEDITKSYRSLAYRSLGGGEQEQVLRGVDFELAQGESVAILGPSGCGKSTLLSIMGTLEAPSAGRVLWKGQDLAKLDEKALARHHNHEVGFVFQKHHLLPQCSALENVLIPTLTEAGAQDAAAKLARARALLERVGLGNRMDHKPSQLSGGECQRVAVVRALIQSPRLLLADEPTGSLDGASAEALIDLLVDLRGTERLALALVTHSPPLAARMERVLELHEGQLAVAASSEPQS